MTYIQTQRAKRPLPVTLIAWFQILKAAFFLGVAALLFDPVTTRKLETIFPWLVIVVSADGSAMVPIAVAALHGTYPTTRSIPVLAGAFAALGLWLLCIGMGLMRLQLWARATRIAVSVLQMLLAILALFAYVPIPALQAIWSPLTALQWRDLFVLVVLNSLVVFYLVRDADVLHAFGKKF